MATRRSTNAAKPLLSCAHLCFLNDLAIFTQAGTVDMDAWTSQSTLFTSRHSVHNGKHDQYIFNHISETVVFFLCSAGFTVGMRNRKRNHQNGCNEPNEVPKLNVCSSETAGTTKTSPTKQAIRLTIMVETSKRWKVEEISSMSVRLLSRIYVGNF